MERKLISDQSTADKNRNLQIHQAVLNWLREDVSRLPDSVISHEVVRQDDAPIAGVAAFAFIARRENGDDVLSLTVWVCHEGEGASIAATRPGCDILLEETRTHRLNRVPLK